MSPGKVNSWAPVKLRQTFDENEQRIIYYLVHMTSPVSIDTLTTLTGASSVDSLNLVERLIKKKVVYERREYKRGIYFFDYTSLRNSLKDYISEDKTKKVIKRIIDFYLQSLDEGSEKTLILADLYRKLNNSEEGLAFIKSAADTLHSSGDLEKAATYYDHILQIFEQTPPTDGNVEIFLDAVLKKIHAMAFPYGDTFFLIKAEKFAKQYMKWGFLARIEVELIIMLFHAGQAKKALRHYHDFRKLAMELNDPHMLKMAALSMGHPFFHKGRFSETIRCYEEAIGQLEEFENDEATLRFCILVGWCYIICGRISRGMGIIDTVLEKARLLNLQDILLRANVIKVYALLEIRKIAEAEVVLNKISLPSSDTKSDHFISLAILHCSAYILYTKKDYEGASVCYKKAMEHRRFIGWSPVSQPWLIEFLYDLNSRGFLHDTQCDDTEINDMIKGNNIYIKGFAYRYRALWNMEKHLPQAGILTDLRESEKYLKMAGAEFELARTRIVLGNYHMKKGKIKIAQSHLAKVGSFFSTVDKSLIPTDLLAVMPQEQKIEPLINKIASIAESLGRLRDASSFLERVIQCGPRLYHGHAGGS